MKRLVLKVLENTYHVYRYKVQLVYNYTTNTSNDPPLNTIVLQYNQLFLISDLNSRSFIKSEVHFYPMYSSHKPWLCRTYHRFNKNLHLIHVLTSFSSSPSYIDSNLAWSSPSKLYLFLAVLPISFQRPLLCFRPEFQDQNMRSSACLPYLLPCQLTPSTPRLLLMQNWMSSSMSMKLRAT